MKKFYLVDKKGESVSRIIVDEERGVFRHLGKGRWGAGCGEGGIDEALESIMNGKSARIRNSVKLIEAV